ncbi:siphovirus ReqiPepy6 Gp37-like family protein [Geomicrobium sp. JCM 19039]|uniref:siphovirus ReqiPepy6 Gp37-like family protein n=1 Tax=Geomicrobium sp. JCM 19039 TaxID=1460636 RepID=UPI00045F244D|nr:siphovirus ReqiPepy6 Gp37-like family protein [Geomicrobium sp. JCM 19039]GAK12253.1 hypothetical protein JCM19039_2008 [Geomicrobium sp. JCM 19039]
MYPLRIFTKNVELLTEIDQYESMIHTRRWSGVGDFQLVINQNSVDISQLEINNLIMIGNDVNRVGRILHREAAVDQAGAESELWTIQGVTLEGIAKDSLTLAPSGRDYDRITAAAETVMKHYFNNNVVAPEEADRHKGIRRKDQVVIAPDQQRGRRIQWQASYKELDAELERMSTLTGLGWYCYLDYEQRKWVMDVSEGRDLTQGQSDNPPVIFSPEFDSVAEQQFLDSIVDYASVVYVAGQGEGAERRIVVVGDGDGLDRRESFVDARDVEEEIEDEDTGEMVPRPVEDIDEELRQRGEESLAEKARKQSFTCQIIDGSPFKYEVDYDLGDIVTVQNRKWGVTLMQGLRISRR